MKQIATNVVNGLVLDYRDMERNAIHHLYHASVQPQFPIERGTRRSRFPAVSSVVSL